MVFVIFARFLSFFSTFVSIGAENVIHFSVFSSKQLNCPLNPSTNGNHS